jgi:polyisoprenoid-binding protein YceI
MTQTTATKAVYKIDEMHSTIRFWVRHMMIAKVHGELSDVTGTITTDSTNPEATEIDVSINVASLTTGNDQRDGHLKSADFLDVEKYPTITYRSKSVKRTSPGHYDIVGDLTVHGVTREVSLKAEASDEVKDLYGGFRIGVSGSGEVNREDFGMTWNQALEAGGVLVGKEVHFEVDAELIRSTE